MNKWLLPLCLAIFLTGCAKDDEGQDPEATELQFYRDAQSSLRSSNYQVAIQKLQRLEARFPFGRYAQQAQLEIIYAYYQSGQPESARAASDRFIRLHPRHPNADYAYYLRGMASFDEDASLVTRLLPIDLTKRDPGTATEAFNDFAELIRRYPTSQYAPDAKQRMVYLKNRLAAYEINVARYYIKRGAWVAAANRGRYVFENFQHTPAVPDGLAIMVEAYTLLGMDELASEALEVLSTNYPDHAALDRNGQFKPSGTGERNQSWLSLITFGLLG